MGNSGNRYDAKFKEDAVRLVWETIKRYNHLIRLYDTGTFYYLCSSKHYINV